MKEETIDELSLEPERYELHAELDAQWEAARCEFFECVGEGLVIVFALDQVPALQEGMGRRGGPAVSLPQEIGVWLHLAGDGTLTAYAGKVEVGQGIRTSLAQVIADELPLPLASIRLVLGDTDLSPFDFGTVGSRTTPVTAPQLRKAAALARETLFELAARHFNVPQFGFEMQNGQVVHLETSRAVLPGVLVQGQKLLKIAGVETPAKPATQWQMSAERAHKAAGRAFITGRHRYTSDLKLPHMGYGKVLRPVAWGARLLTLDASALEVMPDVTLVRDGDFVGVVAPDELCATRAIAALKAEWTRVENAPSTHEIFDYFQKHPTTPQGFGAPSIHSEGNLKTGFASASQTLASTYTVAYIAHVPLEPRAAVAQWNEMDGLDHLTVWTGTQRPFGVRTELAEVFGLPEAQIRVIVPDTGSGYGSKHTGDAAIEAACLARGAKQPVKLVWTREEEFTWAYFRPAGVIEIRSGVSDDGSLVAWEHHNTNSGSAGIRTLYRAPNQHIEFHAAHSPLRQGSYRALAATANHFARETHMDELAHALKRDPLDFRLHNLEDPRLRAVLEAAAERFGWGQNSPAPHHGFGIACGHEKGSYVATCAEVSVSPDDGAVKVVRAVTAFECGAVMNADNVRSQVEGCIIMGLGGALFEGIEFENGQILNACFSRYRLPRFSDIPQLETVLLDRKDLPSVGAGETPIVAIAPAIGNAIFAANGVRLRSMPLAPNGLKKGGP